MHRRKYMSTGEKGVLVDELKINGKRLGKIEKGRIKCEEVRPE